MSATVSVHIVAWNSRSFLSDLLDSLFKQTYTDFSVLVIDNGSTDGVVEFLQEKYPHVRCLRNARNLGFGAAHNQGIRYAIEHWEQNELNNKCILVTNPDIIFTPTFLEELMKATREKDDVGAFGGKLLRAFSDGVSDEALKEAVHSDRIDSTALRVHKNFTCTDRGAGEMDEGQYDRSENVFGITGALVLYRASALERIRYKDEFFDQDFIAYKEDVDLAWRLQQAGIGAWYQSSAVAYHYRGMYGDEKMGWIARVRNRKSKSRLRSYYSTRNHWAMLYKNIDLLSFLVSGLRLFFIESIRFFYVLFFEGSNRKAIVQTILWLPRMTRKRHAIKKGKQVSTYRILKRFAR